MPGLKVSVDGKNLALPKGSNAVDALEALGINPETVLVVREKEIVLESDELKQGDKLRLVKVVSGG